MLGAGLVSGDIWVEEEARGLQPVVCGNRMSGG